MPVFSPGPTSAPAGDSVETLVEATRRLLMGSTRDPMGQLQGAITTTTATSFVCNHMPAMMQVGAVVSIDLELMYVWAMSGTTVTVERGFAGTSADVHDDLSRVYVNPKFSSAAIFDALNAELNTLSAPGDGLYAVTSSEVTFQAPITTYDATGTARGDNYAGNPINNVLRVSGSVPGPSRDWPELRRWKAHYDADLTNFPSGTSVQLIDTPVAGQRLQITYATDFAQFTGLTDNVSSSGLPITGYDLPMLGAAMQLTGVREVSRNFAEGQGDPRRASEVPTNAQRAGYAALALERKRRVDAEAARLMSAYPPRRQV